MKLLESVPESANTPFHTNHGMEALGTVHRDHRSLVIPSTLHFSRFHTMATPTPQSFQLPPRLRLRGSIPWPRLSRASHNLRKTFPRLSHHPVRHFPTVPTAIPKCTKLTDAHSSVRAATLYSGPDTHDTVPFSPSAQSDGDMVPEDMVPRRSPSIASQSSNPSMASSDSDAPDTGTLGSSSQPSSEDFSSYAQLIILMQKPSS